MPGFSLHDELQDLNTAGLTPYQAIRAATANPAEFLGSPKFGVISTGKRADLLLVKANPLKDVKNARKLAGVMVWKKWISEAEIGESLNRLVESYAK